MTNIPIYVYPCKKFLSKIKSEIKNGNNFNVEITKSNKTKPITKKIIYLLNDEKIEEKSWKIIFCIILNPSFFSAYFYAISENYTIKHSSENKNFIEFKK